MSGSLQIDRRALLLQAPIGLACAPRARALEPSTALIISPYGLPFVEARAERTPLLALVDTGGARGVQLSRTLASALNLTLTPTNETTRRLDGSSKRVDGAELRVFELAGRTLTRAPVSVAEDDIERIAAQVRTDFQAILGWRFLGRRDFEIDYPKRRFSLASVGAGPNALSLKIPNPNRAPVIDMVFDGKSMTALVDTGAPANNLDVALANAPAGQIVEKRVVIGGKEFVLPFRVKDLGAMRKGLGVQLVIGHTFLRGYRVRHHLASSTLQLTD